MNEPQPSREKPLTCYDWSSGKPEIHRAEPPCTPSPSEQQAREIAEKKTTETMKMAKASYEEWESVMEFVQELDRITNDQVTGLEQIGRYVVDKMPPMLRVCYGYRVLVDNCCDPNADVLEFKPEIIQQSEKIAELQSALTRSEVEKKFSIRTLEMLDKSMRETSSGWHKTSTELQEAENQLSTLTARLKEAERLLIELHATVVGECPSLLNEDSGGDSGLALAIESFLTTSTPVEKE